ncbi:DnaD domain protein [Lysinibacillus irui]|uniref:DnaD domain protein n=1 Tax=Lysinibacillus irui TaxID=2998077 RepID=UPI002AD397C2|nr:DnaD domain protein [Lysinibacillus irui]MEA0563302.1 DnaD domain protein [Lysinibacillus irui]
MGIIRVAKNSNYVVMNRTALNDNRLSWKAKGIMAYMLSMPDDWVFYMDELITHSTDGKDSFKSGFKELKDNGYVERKSIKDENTKRIVSWETIVHEVPFPQTEKPLVEIPPVENPLMEKPLVENPQLLSTDNNQVLNKPNTDNNQVLTTDTKHAQKLYEFFVSRLQKFPSDKLREDIEYYLSTYHDADLIIEAFERALINSRVTNKEKYATGTLRNWKHEGVTSIQLLAKKEAQQLAGNQHGTTKGQRTTQSELGVDVGF